VVAKHDRHAEHGWYYLADTRGRIRCWRDGLEQDGYGDRTGIARCPAPPGSTLKVP
jgi:hypothetical protein